MNKLRFTIYALAVLCSLVPFSSPAQEREINTTPFTRNYLRATNGIDAAIRLGFSTNVTVGTNITVTSSNIYTGFSVAELTIGTGSNAVTLTPTNGGSLVSDVNLTVSNLTANLGTFNSLSLGGDTRTTWPTGSGGGGGGGYAGGITLVTSFSTNYAPVAGLTNLGQFTNGWFEASWISTNGDALGLETSTNGSSGWEKASANTNSQWLRLVVELANLAGGTAAVSNLVIRSISGASGGTNDFRNTTVFVDYPTTNISAASKEYVDTVTPPVTWSSYKALSPVRLNRQRLEISGEWALETSAVSNELRCGLTFGGTKVLEVAPGFTPLTNAAMGTNRDYVLINVPTNNAPGPFRVLRSTNDLLTWTEVFEVTNSYPSAVGSNYTLTFPINTAPGPWLFYVGRSNAAAATADTLTTRALTGTGPAPTIDPDDASLSVAIEGNDLCGLISIYGIDASYSNRRLAVVTLGRSYPTRCVVTLTRVLDVPDLSTGEGDDARVYISSATTNSFDIHAASFSGGQTNSYFYHVTGY